MVKITKDILALIARIDEFKGAWKAIGTLAPERLNALKKIATIESVGSSTRIEGGQDDRSAGGGIAFRSGHPLVSLTR